MRARKYKNLPPRVFYEVLGVRCERWSRACIEYAGVEGKVDEDALIGWMAAVISVAYQNGYTDGSQKKRRKF